MYRTNPSGEVVWANDRCKTAKRAHASLTLNAVPDFEDTGEPTDPKERGPMSILKCIPEEDHERILEVFNKISTDKVQIRCEVRVKRPWIHIVHGESVQEPTWLLCMAIPEVGPDGEIGSLMGITADISQLKWAESLHIRSRLEAEAGSSPSFAIDHCHFIDTLQPEPRKRSSWTSHRKSFET